MDFHTENTPVLSKFKRVTESKILKHIDNLNKDTARRIELHHNNVY